MSHPRRLRHQIGATIQTHRLWSPGQRVMVAVSGGLDSVVLLDLLCALQGWHGGELEVVTVDHGTRPDSGAHADFVETIAGFRGLPFSRFDLNLGADASEETCRQARYEALESGAADAIAVAHHRDDQAETVLLQLMRGTGTRGLAGMSWRRGRVVRPVLDVPRRRLLLWALQVGLPWVEDPSNAKERYLRNALRHRVLPEMEALRPGTAGALARSATLAAMDADLLDDLARKSEPPRSESGWSTSWVLNTPEALVRRVFHARLPGMRATHVDRILQASRRGSGTILLADGVRVCILHGRVCIHR